MLKKPESLKRFTSHFFCFFKSSFSKHVEESSCRETKQHNKIHLDEFEQIGDGTDNPMTDLLLWETRSRKRFPFDGCQMQFKMQIWPTLKSVTLKWVPGRRRNQCLAVTRVIAWPILLTRDDLARQEEQQKATFSYWNKTWLVKVPELAKIMVVKVPKLAKIMVSRRPSIEYHLFSPKWAWIDCPLSWLGACSPSWVLQQPASVEHRERVDVPGKAKVPLLDAGPTWKDQRHFANLHDSHRISASKKLALLWLGADHSCLCKHQYIRTWDRQRVDALKEATLPFVRARFAWLYQKQSMCASNGQRIDA